jgi:hypothetical protein
MGPRDLESPSVMASEAAITDSQLLERLMLSDEAFVDYFLELVSHFPAREWTRRSFEHGLRYPWTRPDRSYLLRDGETDLLHELDEAERAAILERHLGPAAGRVALLAFGANVAPKNLAIKLAHHAEVEDREVLVLAGELHDLDVVAAAAVAVYGAMPGTLAPSPGTKVRAALMLVNATQLTTLTWGEISYVIGRLRGARFTVEDAVTDVELDSPLAFVSRWGAFAPDGVAAPLAAIAASGRTAPAWTQQELVDRAAEIVLGPGGGGAEALMRIGYRDVGAMAARIVPALRPYARPFEFPGWTRIAPDGTLR